jgi:DNA-nicking Smr family endonuclease
MTRRGKREDLSGDDATLWEHVARTVTRMGVRRAKNRTATELPPMPPHAKEPRVEAPAKAARDAPSRPPPPAAARLSGPPVPTTIEPRKTRRIVRGRDEIEARLDLHGMRQAEAHVELRRFLHRAYATGQRTVLVITGKGRPSDQPADAPFDLFQERDRGVLRRVVPQWLADPDLRAIVVGYTSAHAKHGGDGAFYVQLRNRERHRGG